MDRRHRVASGGLRLGLVIASGSVGVVARGVDLEAADRPPASADRTTSGALSAECRPVARSLAEPERVPITEYRIATAPTDGVMLARHTVGEGWTAGRVACVAWVSSGTPPRRRPVDRRSRLRRLRRPPPRGDGDS